MSSVLNLVTAPDTYDLSGAVGVIQNVPIEGIMIDVNNQGIYWQLQRTQQGAPGGGSSSAGTWEDVETAMLPGSRNIMGDPGEITGIRIRAAVKLASLPAGSTQAVVTIRTFP